MVTDSGRPPHAIEISCAIDRPTLPLRTPERLAETLDERVFGGMHLEAGAQRLVGGTNSRRLVDADLFGDGEVQREVEKGIHLPALGSELLLQRQPPGFRAGRGIRGDAGSGRQP